jgi:hypothetical protein
VPGVDQPLGQGDHLRDVLGGAGEDVGRQEVQQRGVGMECGLVGVGDLGRGLVLEAGGDQHPVLAAIEALVAHVPDVGDVLDVEDGHAVVQDDAPDEIREQEGPEVADMGVAIDRRPAGVHPQPGAVGRLDRRERAGERVAKTEGHGRIAACTEILGACLRCLHDFRGITLTIPTAPRYPGRGLAAMHRSPGGVNLRGLTSCPRPGAA